MELKVCVFLALICSLLDTVGGAKLSTATAESQIRREDGFLEKGRASSVEENGLSRLIFYPTSLETFGADGLLYLRSSFLSLMGNNQTNTSKAAVSTVSTELKPVPANRQQMYFRPVSVTLKCVMALTIMSLLVYTAVSIARNHDELSAVFTPSPATQALTIASRVGNFAPMICMLCVACRMYVLATTEGLGEPPQWVKNCMYTVVAGFTLQLIMVLTLPQFVKSTAKDEAQYDMTGKEDEIEKKKKEKEMRDEADRQAKIKAANKRREEGAGSDPDDAEEDDMIEVVDATGDCNDVHPVFHKVQFAESFEVGELVEFKFETTWIRGIVTSTSPLKVRYEDLKNSDGVEYANVRKVKEATDAEEDSSSMRVVFWAIQAISIVLIYGGIGGVIVGIITFPAQSTKISPAVLCTVCLSILYFGVCLLLWFARSIPGSENDVGQRSALTDAALSMTNTTRKAPMFAVLFLASRMRALNLDPPYGMPPFWMQCCFFGITALMYVETAVAAVIGFTGQSEKAYYGFYMFRTTKSLTCAVNFIGMVTYAMLYPIVIGVIAMTYADGSPAPLSTTLFCVILLEGVYFAIMAWQSITFVLESTWNFATKEEAKAGFKINRQASLGAGISMTLAPILCILFVATRMRALQITQQQGAPPGWAQDCMMIAVFACCTQAFCCLLLPIFLQTDVDEDGNPDYSNSPMVAAYALAVLKYVMLAALHGSVITVCVSVYVMTPETAHNGNRLIQDRRSVYKMIAVSVGIFFVALLFSSAKVIGMAIKMAIEACDDTLLGVQITVKDVALNLFQGYVKIHDLVVHQPEDVIDWTRDKEGKLQKFCPVTTEGEPLKCVWHPRLNAKGKEEEYIAKIHMILFKMDVWRTISTLGKVFDIQNLSINGIAAYVEKPSLKISKMDSNVEYITCHMEKIGLIPPPETKGAKKEEPKKEEPKKEEPKKEEKKKEEPKKAEPAPDIPKVVLGKIVLGDIGAWVKVSHIPEFGIRLPEIHIENVKHDVFHDKEDLPPGEMVGCIIGYLARAIVRAVTVEVPKKVMGMASDKMGAGKEMLKKKCHIS
jgi:hypothetical protein